MKAYFCFLYQIMTMRTKIFCQEFGAYPRLINSVDDDDNDDDRS
jgi:hypothetical protein